MKKRIIILLATVVVGATLYAGYDLIKVCALVYHMRQIAMQVEARISSLTPQRLEKIKRDAAAMASPSQSERTFWRGDKSFPKEFVDLNPFWINVREDAVRICLMGGMDYRGLVVRRSTGDAWAVYRFNEAKETFMK